MHCRIAIVISALDTNIASAKVSAETAGFARHVARFELYLLYYVALCSVDLLFFSRTLKNLKVHHTSKRSKGTVFYTNVMPLYANILTCL